MILRNLIYILQRQDYYFIRFLKFVYSHPVWWKLENRRKIRWTIKSRSIWIITAIFFWGISIFFFVIFSYSGLFVIPFLIVILPFFVGISLELLAPFDYLAKQRKINAAEGIISKSRIKVVGIAGSYGKTSTKEILATILERKLEVIKAPENTNTDIGIADFIIKNKNKFRDGIIFIAEMGAYKRGEIEKICRMLHPSYSILTGINEAHLERFGSMENIVKGKFELAQNTEGLAILNFDDENIRKNYSRFDIKSSIGISKKDANDIQAKKDFEGLDFEWSGKKFETSLLAEHNITLILLCARIAQEFSISVNDICDGVKKVLPVAHRLQPIYNANTNIMVIDDSYNGNFNGIVSGLEVLGRASGRKVVLAPGIVEIGTRTEAVHLKIGELYSKKADLILLIKNRMTEYIVEGLKKNNFTNYKVYEDTKKAHDDLKNMLQRGDTIIFQNDLGDIYV